MEKKVLEEKLEKISLNTENARTLYFQLLGQKVLLESLIEEENKAVKVDKNPSKTDETTEEKLANKRRKQKEQDEKIRADMKKQEIEQKEIERKQKEEKEKEEE